MNTSADYAATYFKYPVPTPINGKPTNKSLKKRNTELRTNASSVDTDFGGGNHGYLGLILADTEYMRINLAPTAFAAPVFPSVLTIDATASVVESVHTKENHPEAMHVYRECNNVKKALLRHTQNAVKSKYTEHLINKDTGLIEDDLPSVLQSLFTSDGKVPLEEVKQRE